MSLPEAPVLSQKNLVLILPSYFFKSQFSVVVPPTPRCSQQCPIYACH